MHLFSRKRKQQSQKYEEDDSDSKYMIRYRRFNSNTTYSSEVDSEGPDDGDDVTKPSVKQKDRRLAVKPRDVLKELETVPTNFSLDGLDDKIEILKTKEKLINQTYAKRDVSYIIQCLEARKKYDVPWKKGEETFRAFFTKFDATDDVKINALLSKYKLVMKEADIFIPEFPDSAVKIMKDFSDRCEALIEKKPLFMVIATEDSFKKAYEKRDPILLAQSPFGIYYYILGAWDEEMILLREL